MTRPIGPGKKLISLTITEAVSLAIKMGTLRRLVVSKRPAVGRHQAQISGESNAQNVDFRVIAARTPHPLSRSRTRCMADFLWICRCSPVIDQQIPYKVIYRDFGEPVLNVRTADFSLRWISNGVSDRQGCIVRPSFYAQKRPQFAHRPLFRPSSCYACGGRLTRETRGGVSQGCREKVKGDQDGTGLIGTQSTIRRLGRECWPYRGGPQPHSRQLGMAIGTGMRSHYSIFNFLRSRRPGSSASIFKGSEKSGFEETIHRPA